MEEIVEKKESEIQVIANNINKGLEAFETRKAELTQLKEDAAGLTIESIDDTEAIKQVSTWRKKLKAARVEIEKEGKSMRDPLTRIGKSILEKQYELIDIISPTEKDLQDKEDWVKAENLKIEQEEQRKEEARIQNRIDRLAKYGYTIDITLLKGIDDEKFEETVESARVEWQKEQDSIAEKELVAQKEREQAEKDRLELKALREKQEEADRIIKEQQDKIERDRLEKEKRDKQESDRIAKDEEAERQKQEDDRLLAEKKEEKKMKDARFEPRKSQLLEMGFTTYGSSSYPDFSLENTWSCYWEQVYDMSDGEWPLYIIDIEEAIERRKVKVASAEKQRAADLEKARLKGIADEQERVRQAELLKQNELEKAGDKAKWADFISKLAEIQVPAMRSNQYRRIAAAARDKMNEIQQSKP